MEGCDVNVGLCINWSRSRPPQSTQPKSVSKAVGEPAGPFRQPWPSISTKTSAPSSILTRPWRPNPGSASGRFERCVQPNSKLTGFIGKSQVTLGTTIAVTLTFFLEGYKDDSWNEVTNCKGGLWDNPPIPDTRIDCCRRGRQRLCTNRSEMKDEDDALSISALASTAEPSGEVIITRQVMSSTLGFNLVH